MRLADHLIILAGGRATRLGPLTATMSKALVTVEQRPMLIRQITGLPTNHVTVVVAPDSRRQVEDVLRRALGDRPVRLVEQPLPLGPADALARAVADLPHHDSALVIMADTLVDPADVRADGTWVGVAPAHEARPWCYLAKDGWRDDVPSALPCNAFIGLLRVDRVASLTLRTTGLDVGMAPVLNCLDPPRIVTCSSWVDVGDVAALARARRKLFLGRDRHKFELDDLGVLTKYGADEHQRRFLTSLTGDARRLFPTVYGVDPLRLEHVDLPSLAELWLYWPGPPALWEHVIDTVIERVEMHLWPNRLDVPTTFPPVGRARAMYLRKPRRRLEDAGLVDAVPRLVEFEVWVEERLVLTARERRDVLLHGDLNLGNVLYSLGTDTLKLIDPRGFWGDSSGVGDHLYDLAKLRYSYRDHFSAICHGLFEEDGGWITYWPRRAEEVAAVDRVLARRADLRLVAAVEATLFLSAPPLHPAWQRPALIERANALITEVLDG